MPSNASSLDREPPSRETGPLGLLRAGASRLRRLEPWHLILALTVLAFSTTSFLAYRQYVFEDSYITYGYARNLAAGKGFVFNEGERVLGTSTPLYALTLAALARLGLPLPVTSEVLFWACLGFAAALGALLLRRLGHPRLGLLFALLQLLAPNGLSRYLGLETPFYLCLLLVALFSALDRRAVATGIFLGLAFLTRYDGFLFAATLLSLLWWRERRLPLRQGLVALAVVLPWLAFAQLYFGSVMPNTLGAKTGDTTMAGFLYESAARQLREWLAPFNRLLQSPIAPIVIALSRLVVIAAPIFAAAPAVLRRERLLVVLLAFPLLLWLGYAAIGPPLAHAWYLIPGTFMLLLLSFACWGEVLDRLAATPFVARLRLARGAGFATVLVAVAIVAIFARHVPTSALDAKGMTENSHYRGRVGAYDMMARWIVDRGLTDLTVMLREPGYFASLTGNKIVDAAGLLTKDVYFHGPAERRSTTAELIERFHPDLVVTPPMALLDLPEGAFVPLYEPIPHRSLLVSRQIFVDQYPRFREAWLQRRAYWPGDQAPLAHPLVADFSAPDLEPGWILGGDLRNVIGRRPEVQYARQPVAERHLHTAGAGDLWGTISSPPFIIDFDTLAFRFAGSSRYSTAARLLVDGQVVLEAPGMARLVLRDVEWPVSTWRGKVGVLQFIDTDQLGGYLVADRVRSVRYRREALFDDFESDGYSARWETTFGARPCPLSDVAVSKGLAFQVGLYGALSVQLPGRQNMISHPFELEADHLALLVFDFGGPSTRVELRVDGTAVREFRGARSERLVPLFWDVRAWSGQRAVLAIVDEQESPWIWIGVDEIRFLSERETPPSGRAAPK